MDGDSALAVFLYGPKGTDGCAGRCITVHAPSLDIERVSYPLMLDLDLLDVGPVIGCKGGLEVAFGPPVLVLALGPVILDVFILWLGIAGLVLFLARGNASGNGDVSAAVAFGKVHEDTDIIFRNGGQSRFCPGNTGRAANSCSGAYFP
jgi:hypothetical protein